MRGRVLVGLALAAGLIALAAVAVQPAVGATVPGDTLVASGAAASPAAVAAATSSELATSPTPATSPALFEPTAEWKEIVGDQHVPGGLEYRIDFAAGKKYARLLQKSPTATPTAAPAAAVADPAAATAAALVVVPSPDSEPQAPRRARSRRAAALGAAEPPEETAGATADAESPPPHPVDATLDDAARTMKAALMGLPEPEPELTQALNAGVQGADLAALLRKIWDRRQLALKEAMSAAKTEAQQMQELLRQLMTQPASDGGADPRIALLEDLEYHVSQLHNALDFAGMGGLTAVTPLLNSSDTELTAAAAWVIGSACKYAGRAQEAAMRDGALPAILERLAKAMVHSTTAGDAAQVKRHLAVTGKLLYAMGALLRNHLAGQVQLRRLNGGRALVGLLNLAVDAMVGRGAGAATPVNDATRVRLWAPIVDKLLALLYDLGSESRATAAVAEVAVEPVDRTLAAAGAGLGRDNETAAPRGHAATPHQGARIVQLDASGGVLDDGGAGESAGDDGLATGTGLWASILPRNDVVHACLTARRVVNLAEGHAEIDADDAATLRHSAGLAADVLQLCDAANAFASIGAYKMAGGGEAR